jgi:hypothetical protein
VLHLDHLRVRQPQAVEAVVRLVMIGWLLHADTVAELQGWLTEVHTGATLPPGSTTEPLSSWRMTTWCMTTLRQQVIGQWTMAQIHACLSQIRRFLGSGTRRRCHLESTLRHALATHGA